MLWATLWPVPASIKFWTGEDFLPGILHHPDWTAATGVILVIRERLSCTLSTRREISCAFRTGVCRLSRPILRHPVWYRHDKGLSRWAYRWGWHHPDVLHWWCPAVCHEDLGMLDIYLGLAEFISCWAIQEESRLHQRLHSWAKQPKEHRFVSIPWASTSGSSPEGKAMNLGHGSTVRSSLKSVPCLDNHWWSWYDAYHRSGRVSWQVWLSSLLRYTRALRTPWEALLSGSFEASGLRYAGLHTQWYWCCQSPVTLARTILWESTYCHHVAQW